MAALALGALFLSLVRERRPLPLVAPLAVTVFAAYSMYAAQGPTAFWRHSGIGVGWVDVSDDSKNVLIDRIHDYRRALKYEYEGVESSVGITNDMGLAFVVNGKVDGSAVGDATTQIMMGMISALLHPEPTDALVVGLGTGSSAGWLASIETMANVRCRRVGNRPCSKWLGSAVR